MTRLARLALGYLLTGVFVWSCHGPATTVDAAAVDDCGCDPGVIVKPVPVKRAFDPIDGLSDADLRALVEEAARLLTAKSSARTVHLEIPAAALPNPSLVQLRAEWTGCFVGQQNRLSESESSSFHHMQLSDSFSDTLFLDGEGEPCDLIEGTLIAELPRKLESVALTKADGPGTTKRVGDHAVMLAETNEGLRLEFSGPRRPVLVVPYGANGTILEIGSSGLGWEKESAKYVASLPPAVVRAEVVVATDKLEVRVPVTAATTEQTSTDLWIKPGPPELPTAREPGAVEASTKVELAYKDRIHRLHLVLPGGVHLSFVHAEPLTFDGEDTAGNHLQLVPYVASGGTSIEVKWLLHPVITGRMDEIVEAGVSSEGELPKEIQEKLDRGEVLTGKDVEVWDKYWASRPNYDPFLGPEAAFCETDEAVKWASGKFLVRYPISFTQLVFPKEGGECNHIRVRPEGDLMRVEMDSGAFFNMAVSPDTPGSPVFGAVVFQNENQDIIDSFGSSYGGQHPLDSWLFSFMQGKVRQTKVHHTVVYKINAWEEFIVPFEFGDVPEGRE